MLLGCGMCEVENAHLNQLHKVHLILHCRRVWAQAKLVLAEDQTFLCHLVLHLHARSDLHGAQQPYMPQGAYTK